MKVKIRYGKMKDLKDFARINAEAFPYHDQDEEKKCFKIHVKTKTIFVAERENKVIGFITFSKPFWSDDTIYIHELAVDRDQRNMGIGGRLLERVIRMAKKACMRRIFLDTRTVNRKAIRFYLRYDFRKVGYIKNMYAEGEKNFILSLKVKR